MTIDTPNKTKGFFRAAYHREKKNRSGDHIWWISDLRKFKSDFPDWKINFTIHKIIEDIYINNK